MMRRAAIAVMFAAVGLAACGDVQGAGQLGNVAPRARLTAPLSAPVGVPVTLDAGASFDPDGIVSEYTFSFTDGSRSVTQTTPDVSHVFSQPGVYEVAVVVKDSSGALARATQLVIVRSDPPSCSATSDCTLGAECRERLCYVTGVGSGAGTADCKTDSECSPGLNCRAGLCLSNSTGTF
jgi:hypothetical protein